MDLKIEQDEPRFNRPAQSTLYQPAVALSFFKTFGTPEDVAAGKPIFVENEGGANIYSQGSKMYLLVDGEVAISVGKQVIGAVGKGEVFGEIASISHLPRTATATAKSACKLISMDEPRFMTAMEKSPEFALMLMNIIIGRLRETIANLTSAGRLSDKDRWNRATIFERKLLADLEKAMEDTPPADHPAGKVMMKEGDKGLFMYVVREGVIAVTIDGKTVEKVGPGGVFGEMALVNQGARAATATAETDCSLLAINRADFMKLVKSKSAFALSLLKALSERLRYMTSKYK